MSCDMSEPKHNSFIVNTDNVVVNQLFGVATGLGMGVLTFDWSQILVIGNPLNIPWWAQVNVGVSFIIFYWFITPLLYYTNVRPHGNHTTSTGLTRYIALSRSGIPRICRCRPPDYSIALDRAIISLRSSTPNIDWTSLHIENIPRSTLA
jgi:hypothetical protein